MVMENKEIEKLSIWKILLLILLTSFIWFWVFWSLCWWFFTSSILYEFFINNHWDQWSWLLIISLPSLIIWLIFIYFWYKYIKINKLFLSILKIIKNKFTNNKK